MTDLNYEEWLKWACIQAVEIVNKTIVKKKCILKNEPLDLRPRHASIFVAWKVYDEFKCGAYGSADNFKELVLQSSEGDEKFVGLVASDFKKLSIVVGILSKEGMIKSDKDEVDKDFLVSGKEWMMWPQEKIKIPVDKEDDIRICKIESYVMNSLIKEPPSTATPLYRRISSILLVIVVVAALLFLRYNNATYSVQWEDFYQSYGVLGLNFDATLNDAKKAYHKLSFKQHPDKIAKCDQQCHEEWAKITDAYAAIKDYHSGRLRILNPPTRFDY